MILCPETHTQHLRHVLALLLLCLCSHRPLSPFAQPGMGNHPLSADSNQITPQGPARSPAPPRSLSGPLKLGFPSRHTPGEGSLPEKQRPLAVPPGRTPLGASTTSFQNCQVTHLP